MNQSQLISKARRDHDVTLAALGELFGCTRQYVQQVEKGVNVFPAERIQVLAAKNDAPEWARELAFRLWLISLVNDYAQLFAELEKLQRMVFHNNGSRS